MPQIVSYREQRAEYTHTRPHCALSRSDVGTAQIVCDARHRPYDKKVHDLLDSRTLLTMIQFCDSAGSEHLLI